MTVKVYMSNISLGCSMEEQKAMLAERVPGWPDVPTYIDLVPPAKRKAHATASLIQRAELLRETSRPENIEAIIVVSLGCLAWEKVDFLQCIAAITARGATLVVLDTDRRIAPDASPSEIADAMQEFVSRRKTKKGGPPGHLVSAERRSAEAYEGAMRIKERWELPTKDYPTDDLLAEAAICRNTANQYLGKRPKAQRQHRNDVARAARNSKRRIGVELQEQAA